MRLPFLLPGMEQRDDLARVRINSRQIRPLMPIAPVAGQSQVLKVIVAAMLPGNDVFDMKAEERLVRLVEVAILAAISRAIAYKVGCSNVHFRSRSRLWRQKIAGLCLQNRDHRAGGNVRFIFRQFLGG